MTSLPSPGRRACSAVLVGLLLLVVAVPARAQEAVAQAKTLYAAASYEEALTVLGVNVTPEAQQYRALCLIALGRTPEAERAIEAMVSSSPSFVIADEDVPPRFAALFARARQNVLPSLIRRIYNDAREQFQAKNHERAKDLFGQVASLAVDPVLATSPEAADLQMLSTGFLDLMKATAAPTTSPAPPSAPAAATVSPAPGAPAPAPADVSPRVMPPVAIRQVVPPWPSAEAPPDKQIKGAVKILIGKDGRVKSAEITTSVDAKYDLDLLAAARLWRYRPATLRGEPVEVENLVTVQIDPR